MRGASQLGGILAALALAISLVGWLAYGTPEYPEVETGLEGYAQSYASFAEQLRLIASCQETPTPDCAALAQPNTESKETPHE